MGTYLIDFWAFKTENVGLTGKRRKNDVREQLEIKLIINKCFFAKVKIVFRLVCV